jgi:hypothetical protein
MERTTLSGQGQTSSNCDARENRNQFDAARCHSLVGWRDRESRRCHGLIKTVKAVLPKGKDERHLKNTMAKIRHLHRAGMLGLAVKVVLAPQILAKLNIA